jgi:hypothetical protein
MNKWRLTYKKGVFKLSIVEVTLLDNLTAVSQEGFGMPLIFVPDTDITYKEVEGTDGLSTLTSGDLGYEQVNAIFSQSPQPEKVAVYGVDVTTVGTSVGDELDSLLLENDDFYFLLIASRESSDIVDAGSWATSNGKLFVGQPDIADTVSNIISTKESLSSDKAILMTHDGGTPGTDPYLDGAIVGRIAPVTPGGTTWKFKNLNGIPKATYTPVELSDLDDNNINTYVKELGVLQTSNGWTTGGSFADIERGKDWLNARIKENIGSVLINAEKVGFEDGGISQIVGALKNTLKDAVRNGLIAKTNEGTGIWSVDAPTRSEVSDSNLTNRILPDVNFEANVAGAIHNVQVNGVLKV